MPAVLMVLPSRPDDQTRRVHRTLTVELPDSFDHNTRRIGPGGDYSNVPAAAIRLRREVADVTIAFGLSALSAAVAARRRNLLFVPDRFLGRSMLRWARALCVGRDVDIVCPTWSQHRLAVTAGIPADRCHVVYPGVDFGRIRRNQSQRAKFGLADDDYVLAAPGEVTHHSGHALALWSTGILNVLDPRYKIAVVGTGPQVSTLVGLARKLKQADMLHIVRKVDPHAEDEDLLSVADAALFAPPTSAASVLPIATTMASGVPIACTVTRAVSELLEDRHTALMVPRPTPRALASRVLDLRADGNRSYHMADAARSEAYEHWSKSKMVDRWTSILQARGRGEPITDASTRPPHGR